MIIGYARTSTIDQTAGANLGECAEHIERDSANAFIVLWNMRYSRTVKLSFHPGRDCFLGNLTQVPA